MASGGDPQELDDPPASLRLQVWENFGVPVTYSSTGEWVVDKTRTVCRRCLAAVGWCEWKYIEHANAYPTPSLEQDKKKTVQLLLPTVLHQPLDTHTNRANKNYWSNPNAPVFPGRGTWHVVACAQTLLQHALPSTYEPNYRPFYIQQNMDVDRAQVVCCTLRFTNDWWVDFSCHGKLTVPISFSFSAYFIDSDWEMKTSVLQTPNSYQTRTGPRCLNRGMNQTVTSVYSYTPNIYTTRTQLTTFQQIPEGDRHESIHIHLCEIHPKQDVNIKGNFMRSNRTPSWWHVKQDPVW